LLNIVKMYKWCLVSVKTTLLYKHWLAY
jgi:hypothetical protein